MTAAIGDNRLAALAGQVSELHQQVEHHARSAVDKALQAGGALIEAKKLVAHGGWGDWLKGAGIPERSAQRYMRLHRAGLESAMVADLGIAEADRVAALMEDLWPEPGRGKHCVGNSGKGAFVSIVWRPDAAPFAFLAGIKLEEPNEHGIPSAGHSVICPRPMSAFGIAMAHRLEVAPTKLTGIFDFEGEAEAAEHLQTIAHCRMTPQGLAFSPRGAR